MQQLRCGHTFVCLLTLAMASACSRGVEVELGETGDGGGGDGATGSGGDGGDGQTGTTGGDGGSTGGSSTGTETGDTSDGETGTGSDTGDSGATGDSGTGDGGTGDDGGTDSGDTGDDDEVQPCQTEQTVLDPVPPYVLLVLDKSGSMSQETWDHDDDDTTDEITRWESLHNSVTFLLNQYQSEARFGAKLYPAFDSSCKNRFQCSNPCPVDTGVEVACALDNAQGVLDGIPTADATVEGGTPMESGLSEGITYLQGITTSDPKAVVLVADGAISCDEDIENAVTLVSDAATAGLPTYVIGIDADSTTGVQLNDLADAGGRPNPNSADSYYQTQNQNDLETAMGDIVSDALSCTVAVSPEPDYPDLFEVWVGGSEIPKVSDCGSENGWVWSQEYTEIEFCGTACDDLKGQGEMEARYYCLPG